MSKTSVLDWDTTAANNTDVGAIGIQGTNLPSNFRQCAQGGHEAGCLCSHAHSH
jgi:hypothetical protein